MQSLLRLGIVLLYVLSAYRHLKEENQSYYDSVENWSLNKVVKGSGLLRMTEGRRNDSLTETSLWTKFPDTFSTEKVSACQLYDELLSARLDGDAERLLKTVKQIYQYFFFKYGIKNDETQYLRKILSLFKNDLEFAIYELEWIRNTIHYECRRSDPSYITDAKKKNQFRKVKH